MNQKTKLIALTALLLAAGSPSYGQTWSSVDILLPSSKYEPGDSGFAVLLDPSTTAPAPGVLLGCQTVAASDYSILRVTPNDAASSSFSVQDLDNALTTVTRLAYNGSRFYAAGNAPSGHTSMWRVRSSPHGDPGTWADEDTFALNNGTLSSAWGLATDSSGNVFVSGMARDNKAPHWIVRHKTAATTWGTVFDAKGNNINMIPSVCFFPGNALNPTAAVLTASDLNSVWIVMRSQSQGAPSSWQQVDAWTGGSAAASAYDIVYDSYSGNIYVCGCRGLNGSTTLPPSAWVIRMSPDGGNTWKPLLDVAGKTSWAKSVAIDGTGAVSVSGVIDPTATSTSSGTGLWKVIRCTNPNDPTGTAWLTSFGQTDTLPFGAQTLSKGRGLAADPSGNLFVTGLLENWTDSSTTPATLYSGARVGLVRLTPTP